MSDAPESSDLYQLSEVDDVTVAAAIQLLKKIVPASFTRPAEVASVAKVLHVLQRLP